MALFYNNTEDTHLMNITSSINQLSKGQDYTYIDDISDIVGESCKVCVVFDGHGSNTVINFIRSIPNNTMNELISVKNPIENIAKYINNNLIYNKNVATGSTMCLVKIYSNRIECVNCGDSQVAIYKNGSLEYMNHQHNYTNEKERERLKDKVIFIPSNNIKMTDENKLISVYSEYIEWNIANETLLSLACSQSLGHKDITGYDPEYKTIPIMEGEKYKIIMGSDGLWDMVMVDNECDMKNLSKKNVNEIIKQTTDRWLQKWDMQDVLNGNTDIIKCSFTPKQCDDISVIVADIIPIK
jgi:serine/threonine protein phosphatase PrpC